MNKTVHIANVTKTDINNSKNSDTNFMVKHPIGVF